MISTEEFILYDLALLIYVLPALLAIFYRLKSWPLMVLLNVVFAWTVFGWLALMIWCINDISIKQNEQKTNS